MNKLVKRVVSVLTLMVVCAMAFQVNVMNVSAATSITGNNTRSTAYNYGSWTSINSNYATIILNDRENELLK